MRIICPTCASHYEVELEKIAAQGQLVRCARCREVWLVRSPAEREALFPEPEAEPAHREPARPSRPTVSIAPSEVIDFNAAKIRLRRRDGRTTIGRGRATSLSGLAVGAVLLSSLMSLYGFRDAIVHRVPVAGAAYAALGLPVDTGSLALRDVSSMLVADGDETVLTLQGKIANLGDQPTPVPAITVVVRSEGHAPLYTWTAPPPKPTLARGETIDFKTRLASPPSAGHDVRVSFADPKPASLALLTP